MPFVAARGAGDRADDVPFRDGDEDTHRLQAFAKTLWRQNRVLVSAGRVAALVRRERRAQTGEDRYAVGNRCFPDFHSRFASTVAAIESPHSRATNASARSIPALTPAEVATRS